jgi:hypothetical protein
LCIPGILQGIIQKTSIKVENLSCPVDENAHSIFMLKILRSWQADIPEADNADRFIEKFLWNHGTKHLF